MEVVAIMITGLGTLVFIVASGKMVVKLLRGDGKVEDITGYCPPKGDWR